MLKQLRGVKEDTRDETHIDQEEERRRRRRDYREERKVNERKGGRR